MKYLKILSILFFSSLISFTSCNEKADTNKQETTETIQINDTATPPAAATTEPAQNAEGVWHYTCSKGCAGGAGAAGTCATCGGTLAHNAAYHANANANATPTTPQVTPTTDPRTPEPAQNAKGVWHYTCGNGCAGGGAKGGVCSSCGGTLVHNAAYHQ